MMKTKHTPGPWKQMKRANATVSNADESRIVAACGGYSSNMDDGKHLYENLANAKLIAAAPEMLETLYEIIGYIQRSERESMFAGNIRRKCEAAIKKATE